jgi:ABC-type phosphate/phosphonate transport system permease subunit
VAAGHLLLVILGPTAFGDDPHRHPGHHRDLWDINIRESTVLGFVGAGGIGILLYSSISQFLWQEVSLMLLAVFGIVLVSEFVSATLRQKIS